MISGKVSGQILIWALIVVNQTQTSELNMQTYKDCLNVNVVFG